MGLVDRQHEQRPSILEIRDHHHADDAEDELAPARVDDRQHGLEASLDARRHLVAVGFYDMST
jgi:hypothetical protein